MGATSAYESSSIRSSYKAYSAAKPAVISSRSVSKVGSDSVKVENTSLDSSSEEPADVDLGAIESDAALLTVAVPSDDATVTVNGHPTTSDGKVRQFMSRGLKDGFVYTYVVEVRYQVDGQEKSESKSVRLRPGDIERVVFDAPVVAKAAAEPVTVVKLHVPSDAQVTLAGNATDGSGTTRTFRTKQLKAGQQWAGYTIRVTKLVNGQLVSKERTLDVHAGSTTELTFDFDDSELAQR